MPEKYMCISNTFPCALGLGSAYQICCPESESGAAKVTFLLEGTPKKTVLPGSFKLLAEFISLKFWMFRGWEQASDVGSLWFLKAMSFHGPALAI